MIIPQEYALPPIAAMVLALLAVASCRNDAAGPDHRLAGPEPADAAGDWISLHRRDGPGEDLGAGIHVLLDRAVPVEAGGRLLNQLHRVLRRPLLGGHHGLLGAGAAQMPCTRRQSASMIALKVGLGRITRAAFTGSGR